MKIVVEPDTILRKKLAPILAITPEIIELIAEMKKAMIKAKGVGLAANQIGKDLQLFVIEHELAETHGVPEAYINPEITEFSRETDDIEEGCLSLPRYWHIIKRSKKVHIKALDDQGKKIKFRARGFLARVLQHEYDHLQGILIKDRE